MKKNNLIAVLTGLSLLATSSLFPGNAQQLASQKTYLQPTQKTKTNQEGQTKLSTGTSIFLMNRNLQQNVHGRINVPSSEMALYPVRSIKGQDYIGAIVRVNQNLNEKSLQEKGILTGTKTGNLWTLKVPVSRVQDLASDPGIDFVEVDHLVKPALESARTDSRTNEVHQGTGLPSRYRGEGVVVGIIDNGFDYSHPTFYDSAGSVLRITRVWDQTLDSGPAPEELLYGTELIGQNQILNVQKSKTDDSHGTHVAGIAAGSGSGTNGVMTGMAPESEIVLVQYGGGLSDIQDGIFYIIRYAQSVNKPAVINLSLGSHFGPHDGTSLFDQGIDYYSDFAIIVGSAGNEGGTPMHGRYDFVNNTIQTVLYFEDTQDTYGSGYVDIWGEENTTFTVAINAWDLTGNLIGFTEYITSSSNASLDTLILFDGGADTVQVTMSADSANVNNSKPNIAIQLYNSSPSRIITLEVQGQTGLVDIWNNSAPISNTFPNFGPQQGWLAGDTDYTVGEVGGTSKRIITVGAYTTRNNYTNILGATRDIPFFTPHGAIAPFSSLGPTADGRTKPDIAAPGNVVLSSLNSFQQEYLPGGDNYPDVVSGTSNPSKFWYYGSLQGTSMSAPAVTGIIALLLEAYPELTAEQAKMILTGSAKVDNFITDLTENGSYTWGYGKVDALAAMELLFEKIPDKPEITIQGSLKLCEGDSVILQAPSGYQYVWSNLETTPSISVKEAGLYYVTLSSNDGFTSDPSDPVEVTVNDLPEVIFSFPESNDLCQGDSVLMSASSGPLLEYEWYLNGESTGMMNTEFYALTSGDYQVVVSDTNACQLVSDIFTITVRNKPAKPSLTQDVNLLTTNTTESAQWYYNGEVIPGAVGNSYEAEETGEYHVVATNSFNCFTSSDTLSVTVVGLEDWSQAPIRIYPNPAGREIYLESSLNGPAKIAITDTNGRIFIDKKVILSGKDPVDLGFLKPGIYLIRLEHQDIRYPLKFMVD